MSFLRLPRSKVFKVAMSLAAFIVVAPAALYVSLLALNAYSSWRLSKMLDSLEAIHVGDPSKNILRVIEHCTIERSESGYLCQVVDFPLHFEFLQKLTWKLPDDWDVNEILSRIGLRGRYLSVSARIENGHVRKVLVSLIVIGRYESLGNKWEIADSIPPQYDEPSLTALDRRTYMSWFHITSVAPGEGFRLYATPASSPEELLARHVNSRCLSVFADATAFAKCSPMQLLSSTSESAAGAVVLVCRLRTAN
jgi:hypothetical protein